MQSKASAIKRSGTIVLPSFMLDAASSVISSSLTKAALLPNVSSMLTSSLFTLTRRVSSSKSTSAPKFSLINLSGTSVLPFSIYGSVSLVILSPFITISPA